MLPDALVGGLRQIVMQTGPDHVVDALGADGFCHPLKGRNAGESGVFSLRF
jgi:hypothetical protein